MRMDFPGTVPCSDQKEVSRIQLWTESHTGQEQAVTLQSPGMTSRPISSGVAHTWDSSQVRASWRPAGSRAPVWAWSLLTSGLSDLTPQARTPAPPNLMLGPGLAPSSRGYGQQLHPRCPHSALVSCQVRQKLCSLSSHISLFLENFLHHCRCLPAEESAGTLSYTRPHSHMQRSKLTLLVCLLDGGPRKSECPAP